MSVDLINKALERKQAKARADYCAALAKSRGQMDDSTAERIAELTDAARVDRSQIEADLAVLEQASALAATAKGLPGLSKRHTEAVGKLKNLEAELQRVTEPLEKAIDDAGFEAGGLERQAREARDAVSSLVGLVKNHTDLLAGFRDVPAVQSWFSEESRREASAKAESEYQARLGAAKLAVLNAADLVRRIRVGSWPYDEQRGGGAIIDVTAAERALSSGEALVAAEKQFSAAEKALKKIEAERQ
jgi:hypothetical protein